LVLDEFVNFYKALPFDRRGLCRELEYSKEKFKGSDIELQILAVASDRQFTLYEREKNKQFVDPLVDFYSRLYDEDEFNNMVFVLLHPNNIRLKRRRYAFVSAFRERSGFVDSGLPRLISDQRFDNRTAREFFKEILDKPLSKLFVESTPAVRHAICMSPEALARIFFYRAPDGADGTDRNFIARAIFTDDGAREKLLQSQRFHGVLARPGQAAQVSPSSAEGLVELYCSDDLEDPTQLILWKQSRVRHRISQASIESQLRVLQKNCEIYDKAPGGGGERLDSNVLLTAYNIANLRQQFFQDYPDCKEAILLILRHDVLVETLFQETAACHLTAFEREQLRDYVSRDEEIRSILSADEAVGALAKAQAVLSQDYIPPDITTQGMTARCA